MGAERFSFAWVGLWVWTGCWVSVFLNDPTIGSMVPNNFENSASTRMCQVCDSWFLVTFSYFGESALLWDVEGFPQLAKFCSR